MGARGPAIFSYDTASDIRGEYRELLEDQIRDDEATRRLIEAYRHLDADQEHVLWLALAAAQSQLGRLDDEVKARALEVIGTGRGLELWEEAGPKELAKRKAALAKLREQLTGPQPRPEDGTAPVAARDRPATWRRPVVHGGQRAAGAASRSTRRRPPCAVHRRQPWQPQPGNSGDGG